MTSESFDPDAGVTLTFTPQEADILFQMLACAADYRDPHHCDPDDALSIFVEKWIEASGWEITEDYGPWSGFIEMVEDLRWRYEHQPYAWRGGVERDSDE